MDKQFSGLAYLGKAGKANDTIAALKKIHDGKGGPGKGPNLMGIVKKLAAKRKKHAVEEKGESTAEEKAESPAYEKKEKEGKAK